MRQKQINTQLLLRARVLRALRSFFESRDYLEVETPIRIPAPAPEAHIDPEPAGEAFLQTSPELCMKRLLAAGYSRLFQISRCFRRQERGRRHLPEFTLLEWYSAHQDYQDLMDQTEALIQYVAQVLGFEGILPFQKRTIDLTAPFRRLSVDAAFRAFAQGTVEEALAAGRFDEIIGVTIEPRLGWDRPVFLYDYPAECAALARRKQDRPERAERFELYIGGLELCNGFSELNDAAEQRQRFQEELQARRRTGRQATPLPEPFLAALERMPAAAGNALGVDRLVMLFADTLTIDAVTAFVPEEL
ncbi:MAG: EF-P lysine aminoacylase EpmA [Desulfobacterales bacterium]|jgi:lysyl-tRNA synthetase class 2